MTRPLLQDDASLNQALEFLAERDPLLGKAVSNIGAPVLRRWPPGFGTLVDVIVGQQLSTAAANAIKARLRSKITPLTAQTLLSSDMEGLRACGLSQQKLLSLRDLAQHCASGLLDLDALELSDDETAIAKLVRVRGIGRWTAEIYLLFALGRPDIWPTADLALGIAAQHLWQLEARPKESVLRQRGEDWRPWRGAAAHFLWHYYHSLTRRQAILTIV